MPTFAEIDRLRANPEPAYPEYEQVAGAARARGSLVDPAELPRMEAVVAPRGTTWCTAVLGFWMPATGLRGISVVEARMLVAADELGLDPGLPARGRSRPREGRGLPAGTRAGAAACSGVRSAAVARGPGTVPDRGAGPAERP
jgi:hypothetical protein